MPISIEFSHTTLAPNVSQVDLCQRVLTFEQEYLSRSPDFVFHALVTDGQGRYGHLIGALNENAFAKAEADCSQTPSMQALLQALNLKELSMYRHQLLEQQFQVPKYFGAFEQGMFKAKEPQTFVTSSFVQSANAVREQYLSVHPEFLAQTVSSLGDNWYSELVFSTSKAHTEQTCMGYTKSEICQKMLQFGDPETVNLTFWVPLLQRHFQET